MGKAFFLAMNILIYGSTFFVPPLKKMGHSVFSVGEGKQCDLRINSVLSGSRLLEICAQNNFVPDVFLYSDDSTLPYIFKIEEMPVPTVFYSIDTYCHFWHADFSRAFDRVLYAQAEQGEKFPGGEHFPLFAQTVCEWETKEQWLKNRDIPVAFVGNLNHKNNPDRNTFFSLFKCFYPIFLYTGNFVPIYKRARIVLNQSAVGELNLRTFEAMGLGCACLADNVPTAENRIAEIFAFGKNSLPTYPRMDVAKAVDFCIHWLSPEKQDELYEIAMNGRKLVEEKHTADVRAARLQEIFLDLLSGSCVEQRLKNLEERKSFARKCFGGLSEQKEINIDFLEAYKKISEKI